MISENYKWSNSIYIKTEEYEFDLHNDYDFHSVSYNVKERIVQLNWLRGTGEWVNQDQPSAICVKCFSVHFFKFEPRDPELPFSEDDCLSSFGYHCNEDWVDGQFWQDSPPETNWNWSFEFHSGAEILVGGERSVVEIKP